MSFLYLSIRCPEFRLVLLASIASFVEVMDRAVAARNVLRNFNPVPTWMITSRKIFVSVSTPVRLTLNFLPDKGPSFEKSVKLYCIYLIVLSSHQS